MTRRTLHLIRSRLLPALIPILFLPGGLAARAQEPAPEPAQNSGAQIRVQVNRVNVGVIVTAARGKFVEGLRQEDFQILDDGIAQPLTNFAAVDEPAQVVLLVETGPAVYFLQGGHLRAASSLLNGLAPGDRVAALGYADRLLPALDFTANKQEALSAMGQLRFNLGFGELNLGASLVSLLEWLASVPGKKTVVLLSTGVDTSAPEVWDALLLRLKTGDVRVLAVSLSGELRTPAPKGKQKQKTLPENVAASEAAFAEADARLTAIAEATGGRAFFPKNAKDFSAAYAQIAQLVRHEYSLSFAPPVHDGKVHTIEVRVGAPPAAAAPDAAGNAAAPAPPYHPDYRIDHRRAYVAPQP